MTETNVQHGSSVVLPNTMDVSEAYDLLIEYLYDYRRQIQSLPNGTVPLASEATPSQSVAFQKRIDTVTKLIARAERQRLAWSKVATTPLTDRADASSTPKAKRGTTWTETSYAVDGGNIAITNSTQTLRIPIETFRYVMLEALSVGRRHREPQRRQVVRLTRGHIKAHTNYEADSSVCAVVRNVVYVGMKQGYFQPVAVSSRRYHVPADVNDRDVVAWLDSLTCQGSAPSGPAEAA